MLGGACLFNGATKWIAFFWLKISVSQSLAKQLNFKLGINHYISPWDFWETNSYVYIGELMEKVQSKPQKKTTTTKENEKKKG